MEEKIIEHLISLYQEKGIDLHYLLDNDYFKSLPFPKRIEILKLNADKLSKSISATPTKRDIKPIFRSAGWGALGGGITGFLGGLAASKTFSGGHVSPFSVVVPAAIGAGYGAFNRISQDAKAYTQRVEMKHKLDALAQDVNDRAAADVLLTRALQHAPLRAPDNTFEKFNLFGEDKKKSLFETMRTHGSEQTNDWNKAFGKTQIS